MSASYVGMDRAITCSAFQSGKRSMTPCKIQGKIVTFVLDTRNLDYCITLQIFLSFLSSLAQAVLGAWEAQTVLACPVVRGGQVLWFWMRLMIWHFFKKSFSGLILIFTDAASPVRNYVLCLLLKYFKENIWRKKQVSRGWQILYRYVFHMEFCCLLSLEITTGIEKDRRDWHNLDLFCAVFNFLLSVKITAEKILLLCRESYREYFNSFNVFCTCGDPTDIQGVPQLSH